MATKGKTKHIPKRQGGANHYYERVSVEEQNERLRERLRRSQVDVQIRNSKIEEQQKRIDRLEREREGLIAERDDLKRQLTNLRKEHPPHWARPNVVDAVVEAAAVSKKKKKIGRPKGLPPNIRTAPTKIDREVDLVPKRCPKCHSKVAPPSKWHSHTQIELPPIAKPVVTKYNVAWCYCPGCKDKVCLTDETRLGKSKYGQRLHTQVAYWKFCMGLTLPKIEALLSDVFDLKISTGQLSAILSRTARYYGTSYEGLKELLSVQDNLHADETGWRVKGKNHWLWSFSNDKLSYYVIDPSRGSMPVKDTLGDKFDGILSSDFYPAYSRIKAKKQKCWTHLLKELRLLREKYPGRKEVVVFSRRIRKFYERAENLQRLHDRGKNIDKKYLRLIADTDRFIRKGHDHIELQCLAKRLIRHQDELYTFIKAGISATNNHAEREIRPAVLMRKTSYGNRSDEGAATQATIMSIIRTCKKNGINFHDAAMKLLTIH